MEGTFFQFSFMHADFLNKTDFKSIFDVSLFSRVNIKSYPYYRGNSVPGPNR
jgi:hypothetical protein